MAPVLSKQSTIICLRFGKLSWIDCLLLSTMKSVKLVITLFNQL